MYNVWGQLSLLRVPTYSAAVCINQLLVFICMNIEVGCFTPSTGLMCCVVIHCSCSDWLLCDPLSLRLALKKQLIFKNPASDQARTYNVIIYLVVESRKITIKM
ncbi:hypothetical protein FKM82_004562 [Ascaphus truei]